MSQEVSRAASFRPASVNETERTVELTIATEGDVGDGVILRCSPGAVSWRSITPVLLSHQNNTDAMAGRLESIRVENNQVVGLARFSDAPAADQGFALARGGCAVSARAQISPDHLRASGNADVAEKWVLLEASLVPIGADQNTFTRSHSMDHQVEQQDEQPKELSRSELLRQNAILRTCAAGKISDEETQRYLDSGLSVKDVSLEIVRGMEAKCNAIPMFAAIHGSLRSGNEKSTIERVIEAKFGVENSDPSLKGYSLARAAEEFLSEMPAYRGRIIGTNPTQILSRAFSTSDFTLMLESTAERVLLDAYNSAPEGIRALAARRELADFRAVQMLRTSQFGDVTSKGEGGEYKTSTFSEEAAATLQAAEFGALAVLTRKALLNDDLGGFSSLISEMARSAARKEAQELFDRLGGFTWTAANSNSAANLFDGISGAVVKLRRQTGVDGARISFEPRVLLVPPELEAQARQVLANFSPTQYSSVAPFQSLALEVDAQLPSTHAYLADTAYPALVLGTIGTPTLSTEEDFSTGNRHYRVQHDMGTAILDQRSIVRIAIS